MTGTIWTVKFAVLAGINQAGAKLLDKSTTNQLKYPINEANCLKHIAL